MALWSHSSSSCDFTPGMREAILLEECQRSNDQIENSGLDPNNWSINK